MSLTAPIKQRTLPPVDTHVGRIWSIIDLGTQEGEYQGKPKVARKLFIRWELPNARHVFDEAVGEEPFTLSRRYTLSMDPKASLRKLCETVKGKFKDDADASTFDVSGLIGATALLQVEHTTRDGKTYADIANVTKLPGTMTAPEPFNKPVLYLSINGKDAVYDKLPEFLQKEIALAPEFHDAHDEPPF